MSRDTKPRVEWIDAAKGICIFFVVMLHVNDLVVERLEVSGWLDNVVAFARPFRMPDFFLIAGLFLAASMRRSWRSYLDTKVVHFLYFYAAWATLSFALFELRHASNGAAATYVYLGRYLDPSGPLWFIHILPIFFVVTRLTRDVPWWLVLGAAAALHLMRIDTGSHVPDEFASRYVFFYSGYRFAPHVFRIASWARDHLGAAIAYLATWGILNGLLVAADVEQSAVASLPLGYAGALAVIISAVVLSTRRWARPLHYIGENSFVIYLGDAIVSMIVVKFIPTGAGDAGFVALGATLATIVISLLAWRVSLRTPAAILYRRPAWAHVPQGEAAPRLPVPVAL